METWNIFTCSVTTVLQSRTV